MKFVISTQEFISLINRCLNVVSQKTTIPILSNILIEAVNDELILTATDLVVGVRCYTEAKILEEGATTLPAKHLAQLIRELTSTTLEISTNTNEITEIKADSSYFKLNGMNKSEFPSLPSVAGAANFKMKQSDLRDMFYRTSFAVSKEDNRYVLTGVLMQISNGEATFIGTDGKRLARSHLKVDLDSSLNSNYIIPLKAVEEILKNLRDEEEIATVYLMSDKIAVEASNAIIVTKLLSGDYPDVNRVIPESSEAAVSLHREELMTLLRQISLFTADNHSVRFSFLDGELRLTANTMEIGEGKVSMPANYHGPKLEIAFNPNFFLDILRHSKGETVKMGITDAYNPGVITDQEELPSINFSPSPLFVLMPMRLNEE